MGVLDDAIREHLDLKRKHGAAEDELQRQEEEALGPARRQVAADQDQTDAEGAEEAAVAGNGAEAESGEAAPAGAVAEPEAEPAEAVEPDAELDGEPAPPPASAEVTPEVADAAPEVVESAPPLDESAPSPAEQEETVLFDAESERAEATPAAPPSGDTPPRGFAPVEEPAQPDEPDAGATQEYDPFADEPTAEPEPAADADAAEDDDEEGDGDVLEDTPDFLQETPEHDRLWFEQKPPRDFDFD